MYKRPSKRARMIRRLVTTIVMTISVLVIVTGVILFILGYRLNSVNGELQQGALVQFETRPSGATVSIDGNELGPRTSTKQSVIAGMHTFMMQREGYQPWAKTLDLKAGTLTWLNYVRLVPRDLTPQTVATYDSVVGEKASPDLKSLLIQQKADVPTFQLVDIRSQEIKSSTLTIPTDIYSPTPNSKSKHVFALHEWDRGGRYMLVKHTYGSDTEWLVLDTQNVARSVNVSRLLSLKLTDIHFAGTNGNTLYGVSEGVLRKLDLASATISRGLVSNVKSFHMFETNMIAYVGLDPADKTKQVAGVYRDGDEAAHVLRRVDSLVTPLSIDISRYINDTYVAIAENNLVTILKGRYPTSSREESTSLQELVQLTAPGPVTNVSFSATGNYVVAQAGFHLVSYEIEHQRQTSAVVTANDKTARELQWLDVAYLWVVHDGKVSIREFDGTNVHAISNAEANLDVVLSQNGRYIYSIAKDNGAFVLQRVKMLLD